MRERERERERETPTYQEVNKKKDKAGMIVIKTNI